MKCLHKMATKLARPANFSVALLTLVFVSYEIIWRGCFADLHPLRSLVTSVLSQFGLLLSDVGPVML